MKPISLGNVLVGLFLVGCSGNSPSSDGAGGALAIGGASFGGSATSTGGSTTATGGAMATGGTTSTPSTGGAVIQPAGGNGTGGSSVATGGKSSTGGASAGGQATGGKSSSGGAGAGGQATGGKSSSGGASAGGQATGGKSSSAGSNSGGQATGGKAAAGGVSAGGQAAGGTNAGGKATGGGTSSGGEGKSAGCGKAPGIASSQYNNGQPISITAGGKQRRFILNVPTNYDNTHPYRLVVAYHQLDGNDKQLYSWQYYGLLPLSNNSTIFVAPNGQKNGAACTGTGNGDSGCGWPNSSDSDLALADAVVAQIEENFCIDTNRIFATGWSYGGSMSYRTGCSRPLGGTAAWGVRGIAIYSAAQLSGNCTPSKPVAFFAEHGTRDSVLNYDNMGIPLAQNFAKANGCTWATPTKVTSGNHVCTNLTGCMEGYPLEFCSFNGDHTPFPDSGQSSNSWGPQEAWKFISQF